MMEPEIRTLRGSDIPDIVEISKTTWEGHDHLPLIIGSWLKNPLCHPFVFIQDDHAIGVANVQVIDEGTTAWMEGLRVHELARKRGLGEKMTRHLVDISKTLGVKRIRLVTSGDNIAPIKLASQIGMKQVAKYQVFWKSYRRSIKWRYDALDVTEISSDDVLDFAKKHANLIPHNAIVKHWDVFEATEKKIQELSQSSTFLAGEDKAGAVLTISGVESSDAGTEYNSTLYASSSDSFLSGLSANLSIAQKRGHRNLFCIHPPAYISLYPKIPWLRRRSHEIQLILHELIL